VEWVGGSCLFVSTGRVPVRVGLLGVESLWELGQTGISDGSLVVSALIRSAVWHRHGGNSSEVVLVVSVVLLVGKAESGSISDESSNSEAQLNFRKHFIINYINVFVNLMQLFS